MYLPVLTDEDLECDPPDHKSGYVAVIGRPNAGKSTLINAIVGQKLSIVTFKPQTTRHRVVGIASDTAYQMILFDTPGIMQATDAPQDALAMFQPGPDWNGPPMAVLLNKADQLDELQLRELTNWYKQNCRAEQVFVGSALSGEDDGVTAIKSWAVSKLPEGPTLYPKSMVSDQPERFFVSEIIREQIFLQYAQEIPYACQVQIADFKEWPGAKDHIRALILVERESQAPILLGAGGRAIKKLGTAARQQIEEFLGRPVYLELSVQVAPAWRTKSDKLKDFGYFDPLYIT
ncbi:prokaryotic type K homology domain-containing protein [Scenedesmus sp. NREL 46B-D3]|nr:prokaryotic type K homology domain-containing protein [Scenedesmus sp. NREL 46B-D3]